MGTFVTQDDEPVLYEGGAKVAADLRYPQGLANVNLPRADDLNNISSALLDLRTNARRGSRPGIAEVHNLRDYLSDADNTTLEAGGTVNATGAMQDIFEAISAVPGVSSATEAIIEVPGSPDLMEIEETCTYIGGVGRSITWRGEHSLSRSGEKGSGFKWVGAEGGTMFDLRAINGSRVHGLIFNGGGKAKYLVRGREYIDNTDPDPGSTLIASSGLFVEFCAFLNPTLLDGDSALFAAGADNGVNTRQASEYNFLYCDWSGCNENGTQGWGFRALAGGNTKNFFFNYNNFQYLYRGIEAGSGDLTCIVVNGSNIGYAAPDDEAALIYGYGNSVNVIGGRFENSTAGYKSRYIKAGGSATGTVLQAKGFYLSGNLPADDYAIVSAGPAEVSGFFEQNGRAGSNVMKIQAGNPLLAGGYGGMKVSQSTFGYNTTQLTSAPIYDGSSNLLTAGDFAKSTSSVVRAEGNVCGPASGNKDKPIPDSDGRDLRRQMWTDQLSTFCPDAVVNRNSDGVYVVTLGPASLKAFGGQTAFAFLPPFSKLKSCVARVTTPLSGSGLTGSIEMVVGIRTAAGVIADPDGLLTIFDAKTAAITRGKVAGDYGVQFDTALGGYIGNNPGGFQEDVWFTITVGAGSIANLSAGAVTFYVEFERLGA